MKFDELKAKSEVELQKILAQSREELRDARFKVSRNELKNVRAIRLVKERIARIMTILKQPKKK
jgi:ribosomal protein L29